MMDQQQGDCGCLGGFLYRSRAAVVGVGITVNSSHERLATCSKIRGTSEEVLLYPVSVRALEDELRASVLLFEPEITTANSNTAAKLHFESLWGFPDGIGDAATYARFKAKAGVANSVVTFAVDHAVGQLNLAGNTVTSTAVATHELVLKSAVFPVAAANVEEVRYYLLGIDGIRPVTDPANRLIDLNTFLTDFFNTFATYTDCWNRIRRIELACHHDGAADAARVLPVIEDLTLAGPTLLRKLQAAYAAARIGTKAATNAEALFTGLPPATVPAVYAELTSRYLALKSLYWSAVDRFQALKSLAISQGFTVTHDANYVNDDLAVKKPPGIRQYLRETWLHEKPADILLWAHSESAPFPQAVRREFVTKAGIFQIDVLDIDPWVEIEQRLRHAPGAAPPDDDGTFDNIHLFAYTDRGYQGNSGLSLDALMYLCATDEALRRRTAIFLPIYDETLSQDRVLVGYRVVKRPLPGVIPTGFPAMGLEERQEYFAANVPAEAGPLVLTLNLAPGEERNVTISKSLEREVEYKSTTSTLVDINLEDRYEFVDETEKEHRRETSTSGTRGGSSGFNLGVAYGPISAGFNSSSNRSRTTTMSDFERDLHKTMTKSASSQQRRYKQEVTTSTSTRLKLAESETIEVTTKNINEGRTLNLIFHEVRRRVLGGLRLRTLSLQVSGAVELVQGSQLNATNVYDLSNDDLRLAFRDYFRSPMPCDVGAVAHAGERLVHRLSLRIAQEIERAIRNEYRAECEPVFGDPATGKQGLDRDFLLGLRKIVTDKLYYVDPSEARPEGAILDATAPASYDPIQIANTSNLGELVTGAAPIRTRSFLYPVPGALYLDAQVGALPATEPYYEKVRQQEVLGKLVESYKVYAKALRIEAEASDKLRKPDVSLPLTIDQNTIINAKWDAVSTKIDLTFALDVTPRGTWDVFFRNRPIKLAVTIPNANPRQVSLVINATDEIPEGGDALLGQLALVRRDNGKLIAILAAGRRFHEFGKGETFFDRFMACCGVGSEDSSNGSAEEALGNMLQAAARDMQAIADSTAEVVEREVKARGVDEQPEQES